MKRLVWSHGLLLFVATCLTLLCEGRTRRVIEKRSIIQNIAVDRMLRDRSFVMSVIDCVLDKAPCDKHGRHLKRLVPEVLRGQCPGCDRNSRTQIRRVISHVQRNFPEKWSEVVNRFIHSVQNPSQSFHNVFG